MNALPNLFGTGITVFLILVQMEKFGIISQGPVFVLEVLLSQMENAYHQKFIVLMEESTTE